MKDKKDVMMLGFNEAGMQKASKITMYLFGSIGILFGLGMMLFFFWIGLLIILGSIVFIYAVRKSKHR